MTADKDMRSRVAKALGRTDIPDDVWDALVELELVEDAQVTGNDGYESLVAWVRRFTEFAGKGGRGRTRRPRQTHTRQRIEDARSSALASFVAAEAAQEPRVRTFRQDVLGGRLLSQEEVRAFVSSPAPRLFSIFKFQQQGVVPAECQSRLIRQNFSAARRYSADVYVDPPGEEWSSPERLASPLAGVDAKSGLRDGDQIIAISYVGNAHCWQASVLSDTRKLAEQLAHRYRWQEPEAAAFLLMGFAPPFPAIDASVGLALGAPDNTITLKIRPYVSPARVMRVYQLIQRGFDLRPRRPVGERNLGVLRFVSDETNRQGKRPTWRRLMELWNEANPNSRYKDNRLFWRDYERARRVVEAERFGAFGWTFRPERVWKEIRNG